MQKVGFAVFLTAATVFLADSALAQSFDGTAARNPVSHELIQQAASLRAHWAELVARGKAPAKIVEPSVAGGKILTPKVNVTREPGVPEIQITVKSGTVGISGLQVTASPPSGSGSVIANISLPAYPPGQSTITVKSLIQSPFSSSALGLYAQPGVWSISQILLATEDGNFIIYGPAQIASLFSGGATFTLVNPNTPDITPPVAGLGTILTPSVSLSSSAPTAAAQLAATDDVSGVSNGEVTFTAPGDGFSQFSVFKAKDAPARSATLVMSDLLSSSLATGTYTISSFSICDYAGNCLFDSAPADIAKHFSSTTISVTP